LTSGTYSWKILIFLIWPLDQFQFLILFLIVFYSKKKIRKRSLDDVTITKFNRNSNFVPDDILPNVVACLRNQRNCSPDGFHT
jgi:hypothetical protein